MSLARRLTAVSSFALAALALAGICAAEGPDDLAVIWKDPAFQKQFIGAYGVNADIEPRITPEDTKILEKVRPFMADDLPKAQAVLTKAMSPDCSAILDVTLGGILFQQDRLKEALASYQRAVAKFPSFRRAWRSIGLIQARNGNFDEAIRAFTRMIELGGGDSYSYGPLGIAYAAKQDYQAAEVAFRNALLLQPENTEWRYRLTLCAYRQKKFEDTAALLDTLLERYPDKPEFWMLQAQSYLGMKQPLRAAENIETLALMGKAAPDSLYTLGDIYFSESLMDLAARAYQLAIATEGAQSISQPLGAAEKLALRGAFAHAGTLAAAIREKQWPTPLEQAELQRLLKLEVRVSMAGGGGDAETARVLEEIVELDPLDGDALMLLGQHYARENQPDKAIFYYERAASIDAFEVRAKFGHAQILIGMGRYNDAIPLLRRVQELRPRDDVARYLEQIERNAKTRR